MVTDEKLVGHSVKAVATSVARQHHYLVPVDDLVQDGWEWVLRNDRKISGWVDDDDSPNQTSVRRLLKSSLRVHLHNVVMKERYERTGCKPGDFYFYTPEVIEELLPEVLDGHSPTSSADMDVFVSRSRKPNEGFEREAMRADIQAAFLRLSADDKRLLWDRFAAGGLDVGVIAELSDTTQRQIRYRLSRAINRIIRHVGGEQPKKNRRKAMSNAAAVSATRDQEVGKPGVVD